MSGDEEDVLSQVRQALEELDIGSPESREALVEGVREAIDQVAHTVQDVLPREGKPDLRVVDEPDEDDGLDPEPRVSVRWVSTDPTPTTGPTVGRISVPGETADPAESWQTVLHAPEPRAYRLACAHGVLEVVADDAPIARMRPGQTLDVEASSVRVRGVGGPASGTYVRQVPWE